LSGGLLRERLGHREMGKTRFYDKRGGERGEWHYSAEESAGTISQLNGLEEVL
jgi:hypothetical protein